MWGREGKRNRQGGCRGGKYSTVAGTSNVCTNPTSSCGDGGPATSANLNFPQGVAIDSAGNLYIADTGDNRVRVVTGGTINRYAGNGGACLDSTQKCGDGHDAENANLFGPQSIAFDSAGNGYIADTKDHRIRKVDNSGVSNPFAAIGIQNYAGYGGPALA